MALYAIDGVAPTLADGAWVAPSADVIGNARLGTGASIWFGAGALVTEGKTFPPGSLIVGVPAKAVRALTPEQIAGLRMSAADYVARAAEFAGKLRRID